MNDNYYISMIMERTYIKEGLFLFNPLYCTIGTYDEKAKIFTSTGGSDYCEMTDTCQLSSEIPKAFHTLKTLDEINDMLTADYEYDEAVDAYEQYMSSLFYLVTRDGNLISCQEFNISNLRNPKDSKLEDDDFYDMDDVSTQKEEFDLIIEEIKSGMYDVKQLQDLKKGIISDFKKYQYALELIDKNMPESNTSAIDINSIHQKITKTLIAQDLPSRRVLLELNKKLSYTDEELELDRHGILLTGSLGVGKTKLVSLIAKNLDIPLLIIDSTQLSMPGYKGRDIEDYLWNLYASCGRDKNKAEHAIVYFDEIDKKGSDSKSDVSGQGVLNTLLKFADGTDYIISENPQFPGLTQTTINTSKMILMAGGAFVDLYQNISKRNNKVGFKTENNQEEEPEPTLEDFINVGMSAEFMRRFPLTIHLKDLSLSDFKDIVTKSDESSLLREQRAFERVSTKLTATDEYIERIAEAAYNSKIGASGLSGVISRTTWRAYDTVVSNPGKYKEVILLGETVDNPSIYKLVEKEKTLIKK